MNTPILRPALVALGASLALTLIGIGLAQSNAAEIINQVGSNLEKSPWQATVLGKFKADGNTTEIEADLQVISGPDATMRIDFKKPAPVAGNFSVLTRKEAWNFLFVTNQIVIEPRAGAKLSTLVQTVSGLGDVGSLDEDINFKLDGEEATADGVAWKLTGTPKKSGQAFASAEVLILKSDPRILSLSLKDAGGKVTGTLDIRNFKRAKLNAKDLTKYPSDATVVKK